jgi:hypothetical protein
MAAGDVSTEIVNLNAKRCAVFDGVDDYVEIPHHESQLGSNLSDGFTISAWINPRSGGEGGVGDSGRILDKSSSTTSLDGFSFRTVPVEGILTGLRFRINGGTLATSGTSNLPLNTWQHVLLTVSSGQLANFYVNGVLSGNANQDLEEPISAITTTNAMRIGQRSEATDRTFDGRIADVKMWNRVLTTDEIAKVYGGSPVTDGLILDVPLKDDYTEKAKGLTLTNSGSSLAVIDDAVANAIKDMRVTANDRYFIEEINNKIMITHTEEAA